MSRFKKRSQLEFCYLLKVDPKDGIIVRCFTFERNEAESHVEYVNSKIRRLKQLDRPIIDFIQNEGFPIVLEDKIITGSIITCQLLELSGCTQLEEKHELILPLDDDPHQDKNPEITQIGEENKRIEDLGLNLLQDNPFINYPVACGKGPCALIRKGG